MKRRPILFLLIPFCIIIIIFEQFSPVIFIRNHYSKHYQTENYYQVLIKDNGEKRNKRIRYRGEIKKCLNNDLWHLTEGEVLIYLPIKDSIHKLSYGDLIITDAKLSPIENFYNTSSSFDYKKMMRRKRIYHNIFIREDSWKKIGERRGNFLIDKSKKANQYLKNKILHSKLPNEEKGLAIGMLLGDKSSIDKDTKLQFSTTGIAHILCVSGLHIAIILLFFDWILKFIALGNSKFLLIRKFILVIISFVLCFIVGLTPSSLRVATMLSILLLSKYLLSKNYDSLNTLFLTAFIFLVFNPLLLFNISFQLSFLAVLGIIIFTSFREQRLERFKRNVFTNSLISTAGLTLSAQIFTLPIIIYNFKTFPTYFILTNIIIIPFLSVILITIILFLIFGDIIFIGTIIESILHYELLFLRYIVGLIDSLPYSSIALKPLF